MTQTPAAYTRLRDAVRKTLLEGQRLISTWLLYQVAQFARDVFTEANLSQMGLNERQIQAVKLIKEKGPISLSDLKPLYPQVVDRTLNRDLQALVLKKILKAEGEKKGRRYRI